jgi:predicted DNA-binding transcriptional regulator AlpA
MKCSVRPPESDRAPVWVTVNPLTRRIRSVRHHGVDETNDALLTVVALLEILGVTRNTFDKWRRSGRGPAAYRLPNGSLRFRKSDVEAWFENLLIEDTESVRRREVRNVARQGKRIPLRLYGPPTRDIR